MKQSELPFAKDMGFTLHFINFELSGTSRYQQKIKPWLLSSVDSPLR
jgi:hypothetical protein